MAYIVERSSRFYVVVYDRQAQFTALAVAGSNVGLGALAADLSAYLAGTVRVQHEVDDVRVEHATVNAETYKLSFKPTDKIPAPLTGPVMSSGPGLP